MIPNRLIRREMQKKFGGGGQLRLPIILKITLAL